ncbi:hypothetical protein BD779DRAFT_1677212 [Infundibulicybe gibba]|nr:hypothetical protein BD779DRAFT_1677212 [Infundibulicybe gibba]
MQLFESVIYHLASSIPPARQDELALVLNNNGATSAASVADATHIITNSLRFEGWADATAENVVIDKWVDKSLIFGKLQPAQFYSPDPSMIFSGVVACAAELSAADLEVLSAGITALGGQWRIGLTKDVTHLFAISPKSNKYATAMHFQQHTRVIVLLPHWFDDSVRLGMRGLDTAPYAWPDPVMMRGPEASNALEKGKSVNRVILRSTTSQEQIGPVKDVWGERRILLSASLELSPGRREAVQAGIERAKGVVVELGDAEDEAEAIERCDVLVTRFRSGAAYLRAVRAKKTVGTLAWVWHVQSTGVLTRPVDQLLHYPIPRRPVEGFEGHEITVTNYTGESREYLKKLITTMGATFTPSMSGKNTVLIAAYISGIKTTKAASWSIPIVNHTWLEDCFVRWRSLTVALEKYIVFPPGVDFGAILGGRGVGRVEDESDLMDIEAEDAAEEGAITGAGTQESGKEAQEVEAAGDAREVAAAEVDHPANGDDGEAEDEPVTRPRSPQKQRDRGPEKKASKRPEKDSSSSSDVEVLGSPSAVKTRRKQPSAPPPPASSSSSLPEPEAEVVVKKPSSSAKKASNGASPAKSHKSGASSKLGVRKRAAAAPSDSDSDSDAIVVEKRGRVGKGSPKKAAASPAKSHKSTASPKPARKRAAEISSDSDSEVVSPVRAKNGAARGGKAGASPTKTYISASKTSARAKRARALNDDEQSEEIDAETPEVEEEEKRPQGAKRKSNEHKAGGSAKRKSNEGAGRGAADLFESASGDEEVEVRRASGSSNRAGTSRKAVIGRASPVKTKGRTARAATEEEDEEEDEDPRPKSVKTKSTPRKQPPMSKSPAKTKGKVVRAATEEEDGEEEDGEEDDDEIPKSKSAKTKSTPRKQPPTSKNKKRDTSETDTDSDATPPSLPMHTQRKRVSNEGGATKTKVGKSTERPASSVSKKPTPKKPAPKERSPSPAPKRRVSTTLVPSPSKKQSRAADAMDVDSTEGDSDSIPPPPKRPPRSSAASASHTARSRATKGSGVVRVESPTTSTTEPVVPSPAPEEMQISARGPSMRGAAAKATQKLRDEIMPDLVNYQNEMKKGRKSVGGGGGAGVGGEAATSSARRKRAEEAVEKEKGNGRETKRRKVESDEENGDAKKGEGKAKAKAKAESDEDVKKGRGKAKTKAKAGSESESESEPVQITKGKGKAATAPLSKSSGLDQSTTKKEVKLMTTQVTLSDEVIKALGKLGVRMTMRPSECTHLIVPHLVRTEKFLCALAVVPHILTEQWALKSAAAKKLLPEDGFVLKDKVNEKKYDFSLAESLERAKQLGGKLFDKQTFYITPRVPIETKLLKNVVTACGGQITTQTPSARILSASPNRHIISCADDVAIWRPIAQIHPVYSHELLLTAALKQEIEWDNEKFKVPGSF